MSGRTYRGQRALRITFRTVHIGSIALLIGAATWDPPLAPRHEVCVLSGAVIVGDDVYKNGPDYFRFLQSWSVFAKLALLFAALTWKSVMGPALWIALVIGSVISHAPGRLRHLPLWGPKGPCSERTPRSEVDELTG